MTTLVEPTNRSEKFDETVPVAGDADDQLKRIRVTDIRTYDRNPRRQLNPEYLRIKASIRTGGLDQPLVITQEPGAEDYVLQAGGNTRLQVLKELFEETGDEHYGWVNCVVKPWAEESSMLFAHLRENELRGNLPFIDKARAVFDAKALLEKELQVDELTQRQLEKLFRERGYSLSHSMISKMGYAVHTLWPLMPKALQNGLGRPQVEKVRSLERAALKVWLIRALGDQSSFESVFAQLCQRYDTPEWDIQPLRSALETEIAEAANTSFQVVRLELDTCQAGRPLSLMNPIDGDNRTDADDHSNRSENPPDHPLLNPSSTSENGAKSFTAPTRTLHAQNTERSSTGEHDHTADPVGRGKNSDENNDENNGENRGETADAGCHHAFRTLRLKMGACAQQLAEHHGLADCVQRLPEQGLGFLLLDVPSQDLRDTLDHETLEQVNSLWWLLASCCDLTTAPKEISLNTLAPPSVVHHALVEQDVELLLDHVSLTDPGRWGEQLWSVISDEDWQQLLNLMTHYRTLKRKAWRLNTPLWHKENTDVDQ
ncbi:ParB N-terminal domain-containing protein [Pseudomaricurvus alkylphenolicus]|uniref:ParB family protein n=1 Tax=Pseudomaricurvus alkylphenolicus TaxID=1306991 RepID=UPI0014231C11|nr:ParB family protein [Pseudomaricurvus alkylphenolicus]NIB44061.1 ParB N-terminal domain-containing protein [Pseudomaricurvus alkylphenolicus]